MSEIIEGKIGRIASNDLENIPNLLAGKFGWSSKDKERRFYLQNVIIGKVSEKPANVGTEKDPVLAHYLEQWKPKEA